MMEQRIIVSKDEDFLHLSVNLPIRLIWVRVGNCRRGALLTKFEWSWLRLVELLTDGERIVELR